MKDLDEFWKKARRLMGKVPFMRDVVALGFCVADPATPLWAGAQIVGALVYFACPADLVPDAIPVLGFTDDAAVIAAVIQAVRAHLLPRHYAKADAFLRGEGGMAAAEAGPG